MLVDLGKHIWARPFSGHRNTSSCEQTKLGIPGALSSRGHILAIGSISLFLYLYQSLSRPVQPPSFPPSVSISSTFPFIQTSLHPSLFVSFTTIYLSVHSSSYLPLLHISITQCIKMPHLDPLSAPAPRLPSPRSKVESISSALWKSICPSFPPCLPQRGD